MANATQKKQINGLRVTAKRDGFRRAGRAWSGETKVPVSEFNAEQVKQLREESQLIVSNCKITLDDKQSESAE